MEADKTVCSKWTEWRRVTAVKLGACSVVAVFNAHGYLLSNISPDGARELSTAAELCQHYRDLRGPLFRYQPVKLWILYEQENRVKGSGIKAAMQGVGAAQIFEQVYSGESFMQFSNGAGAQFSLALEAGSVKATMQRQDGCGSEITLSADGSIVNCP